MRLYSFTNVYLSQLQKGLQTAHLVSELAWRQDESKQFREWAWGHKTIIILDGGNHSAILDIYHSLFALSAGHFPVALFEEDQDSMNSMATCCGIILPAEIYEWAAEMRENPESLTIGNYVSNPQAAHIKRSYDLANFINNFRLSSS